MLTKIKRTLDFRSQLIKIKEERDFWKNKTVEIFKENQDLLKRRRNMNYMEISKEFTFDSSHRLHNPDMTDEWNKATFGKCNNLPSHGHRWKLVVTVEGQVNPNSGFVTNFAELKKIINESIVEKFDHNFLNDIPEVTGIVPSCENMLPIIKNIILEEFRKQDTKYRLKRLALYETPSSWATLTI